MPWYHNPNNYTLKLLDANGRLITINPNQQLMLDDYFDKYCVANFITKVEEPLARPLYNQHLLTMVPKNTPIAKANIVPINQPINQQVNQPAINNLGLHQGLKPVQVQAQFRPPPAPKIVGATISKKDYSSLQSLCFNGHYPINGYIGVGILTMNRASSLKRLIDSIDKYTDLSKVNIFVSDDCSTSQDAIDYLHELSARQDLTVILNKERKGIAGNSNRLLQCLSRFEHALLLNDDVEIMAPGWETFYSSVCKSSGLHHLQYRQFGVYGAHLGQVVVINGHNFRVIHDKPHGAVMAFTSQAIERIGAFDELYGLYGFEHVDWSMRAYETGLQQPGFYDALDSDKYFKIHAESSTVAHQQSTLYQQALQYHGNRVAGRHIQLVESVPSISVVVPYREQDRSESIKVVLNGLRAQRFPSLEIILVEHDQSLKLSNLGPMVKHLLAVDVNNGPFNKSMAFNVGVNNAKHEVVVLHDADMIMPGKYLSEVFEHLKSKQAIHLGKSVAYLDDQSTRSVHLQMSLKSPTFEHEVGYHEGGSLGCHKSSYWAIGGFNHDFVGYGCEDCEFYRRLKSLNFERLERHTMLHLKHPRTHGWEKHHQRNKEIDAHLLTLSIEEVIKRQLAQTSHWRS